jgi:integrase
MGLSFPDLSFIPQGAPMSGTVRTKEKCPFGCRFEFDRNFGFFCLGHKTFPRRVYLDISWKGHRIKVYSDKDGMVLDSYQRAVRIQSLIDEEIREGSFDPTKYIRQEQEKFWIRNLLDRFQSSRIGDLAPSYRKDYRRMARVAAEFFGVKDVRELRKVDLVDYKNWLEGGQRGDMTCTGAKDGPNPFMGVSGSTPGPRCGINSRSNSRYEAGGGPAPPIQLSPKTVKNYLDHFKVFLRWCRSDLEIINQIPTFPHVELSPMPFRWLSQEDQVAIFDKIPEADRPIIHFLALHGCRPGEVRALRIQDVNLGAGTVSICSTFSGRVFREKRKGRGSKAYTLPIHSEMWAFVKHRAGQAMPGAYLFINARNGGPYTENKLRRVWDAARKASGLDSTLRLYDATRHSCASQLRAAGVGIEAIRDHLGHSDIRTTLKYAHGTFGGMRANLEKLSMRKIIPITVSAEQKSEVIKR